MTLMEQCQIWNENDEYQKIVDAHGGGSARGGAHAGDCDSELARAFNNLANPGTAEGRALLQARHWTCCGPMRNTFRDDHCWNFRMAYAYYYLDQEGPALHVL